MANAQVIPFRRLTDDQAFAWLAANSPLTMTCTALAQQFGWHRNTVGAKLRHWADAGKIERRGKCIKVRSNARTKTAQGNAQLPKILGCLLILCGIALAVAGFYISMNMWAAFFGQSESAFVLRIFAFIIELLTAILPVCAKFWRGWAKVGAWALWGVCIIIIVWSAIGFSFGNFGDTVGNRGASIDRREVAQQQLAAKRLELAAMGAFTVVSPAELDAAVDRRKTQCDPDKPAKVRFCSQARSDEERIARMLTLTNQKGKIEKDIDRLDEQLKAMPVLAAADPQIAGGLEAMKKLLGFRIDQGDASAWRDVIFALVLSFFPGLLIRGGLSLCRD